jgi:hypothetical protein
MCDIQYKTPVQVYNRFCKIINYLSFHSKKLHSINVANYTEASVCAPDVKVLQ